MKEEEEFQERKGKEVEKGHEIEKEEAGKLSGKRIGVKAREE